jgi:lipid-binding SYLF domain-containing protein
MMSRYLAAGPKGRTVEAATDASLRAEILSYSRSRGLFAGMSLEGTKSKQTSNQ